MEGFVMIWIAEPTYLYNKDEDKSCGNQPSEHYLSRKELGVDTNIIRYVVEEWRIRVSNFLEPEKNDWENWVCKGKAY